MHQDCGRHPVGQAQLGELLGAEPDKAVLIEASDFDMEAAANAGARGTAYANEPGKVESLVRAGADAVIDNMADLATAIRTDAQ
ncbi:hypothetical protein SAMN05216276_108719 [Streptosporangium subroseum]|uniref:Haloacid dehalogenase superfamily, subfamily IA, variant 3 with third motif having DD or ED n=1 Tax=Streptosporangium subroseum TaxID=106412 RepID=A0A239P612_9ACTN|nr:hypothetical protein [Streptosporangium subroseum]SNT62048.1 hypothetical protein SAMN05216276_108719 [Streptosporangium subroseum]